MLSAPACSMIASFALCVPRLSDGAGRSGSDGSGPFAVSPAPAGAPLASLAGGVLARRFYGWRGASGARYVATVHAATSESWMEIDGALALIVDVDLDGRRRLVGVEADPSPARRGELRRAALRREGRGVRVEAHLHLLAETASARARAAADLAAMIMA